MDNFFIYQYFVNQKDRQNLSLVIFCSGLSIDVPTLKERLRDFFRRNPPPKKIFVIGGEYLKDRLSSVFVKDKEGLFDVIPNYLIRNNEITVCYFDSSGVLRLLKDNHQIDDQDVLLKAGIFEIFKTHGGLIEAPSETYHYVFPSGKHSAKFIRAGNVLVNGSEITFIAISLLKWLKINITHIYSDTSSINSLVYALLDLKRRFNPSFNPPAIVSFGSYEKFENFDFRDSKNSLVIISASTSGRIIKRLIEKHQNLRYSKILILFYLSGDKIPNNVICDLTCNFDSFPEGFHTNEMYENEVECLFCQSGSYTVKISGDIFLLEKPKINAITINKNDAPDFLSRFMQKFHSQRGVKLIRCFYGEDPTRIFEVFFKTKDLISKSKRFSKNALCRDEFIKKIDRSLTQFVPVDLKLIIHLDDDGSKDIAFKIRGLHGSSGIRILSSKELLSVDDISSNETGAIVIVGSCLVTGNNLLYVNKYLRRYDKMTKTFFNLISRTESDIHYDFVKKNIGQGEFGINTNHFIHIEKITCSQSSEFANSKRILSWSVERNLLKELLDLIEDDTRFIKAKKYFLNRLSILNQALDRQREGLIDDVFLKNPITGKTLKINKNFAFFDFDGYHQNVSQADIYFTISTILNHLRVNNGAANGVRKKIIQEEQIRTIIDPGNFIRYDDGIIQASILRAATADELNYRLSSKHSNQLTAIILKMVDNYRDALSSEGLIEFLLAIIVKKLKLSDLNLIQVLDRIESKIDNSVYLAFCHYIRVNIRVFSAQRR